MERNRHQRLGWFINSYLTSQVLTPRGPARWLVGLAVVAVIGCSGSSATAVASPVASASASPQAGPPVADASCAAEAGSHSVNSDHPTSFTITNHTSETLTVLWLNFKGQREKYFDLPAGQSHDQNTFVTHPWVVADPHGNCVRLFTVTTTTTITIG
jgi:hypothetical protein